MKKLLEAINNGISIALKENNIEFSSVENIDDLDDTDNLTITSKSLNTKPGARDYIENKIAERRQEILSLFSEWVSKEINDWRTSWDCDEDGYAQCKNDLESAEDYFNNEYETFMEEYEISEAEDELLDWDNDLLPIIQSEVIGWETWAEEYFEDYINNYWGDDDNDDDDDWNDDED
jgi:hypothetical protein